MGRPAFTVIIPAYNERELVPWAIRSVQAQTRTDWEVIVVDDGSTDDTADVVRPFTESDPRIRLLQKENAGLSAARNSGLDASEAPLVSFLDSDDMWLPPYLEWMGEALEADPGAGVAYTDAWAMDADTGRFRRATAMASCQPPDVLPADPEELMLLLIRQNFIWVSTTVRREALERAGRFREDFKLTEDIELWFRMLKLGYGIVRAEGGVLGIKRERAQAMSRQDLGNIESLQRVLGMVSADEGMPDRVRGAASAQIDTLEPWRLALSGESRTRALALRGRRMLGGVRRAAMRSREWRAEPPLEVQAAFPELSKR